MPKDSTRGPEVNPFRLLSRMGFHACASELYKATVALVELAVGNSAFCNNVCCKREKTCTDCPHIEGPCPVQDLRRIICRGGGFQP